MAEANSKRIAESIREDYLTCAICCETFKAPRVLQCGHSFCLNCLQDYVKTKCSDTKRQLPCPMCRQTSSLEMADKGKQGLMKWVENLSSDSITISVLQAIEAFVPLGEVESSEASTAGASSRRRICSEPSGKSVSHCLAHPDKVLEVFCSKHDQVVCAECAWREHRLKDCICIPVSEVIERRLAAMQCLVAQQDRDASRLLESTENSVKSMPNLKKSIQENLAHVGDAFEEMCKEFRERLSRVTSGVDSLFEENEGIQSIKTKQDGINAQLKLLSAVKTNENPQRVLHEISQVWNNASDFQKSLHALSRMTSIEQMSPELGTEVRMLDSVVQSSVDFLWGKSDDSEENQNLDETRLENNYVIVRNTICDPYEASDLDDHKQWVFNAKRPGEMSCTLSGLALIGNSSVVLADQYNRKLKQFKLPEGYFQGEVRLNAEPNQIATLKESNRLAVTVWDLYKIYIVSTDPSLQLKMVINTDIEYTGIVSPLPNCLALSCIRKKRVDVVTLDDAWFSVSDNPTATVAQQFVRPDMVRTIHKSSFPDRLGTTSEDHILVKNRRKRNVDCIETEADGKFVWSRQLPAKVMDIASCRGRLFATLGNRNRVVHCSDSGMGALEELKGEVDFKRPWCVAGFKNCLVVTEDSPSDKVHVFVFN